MRLQILIWCLLLNFAVSYAENQTEKSSFEDDAVFLQDQEHEDDQQLDQDPDQVENLDSVDSQLDEQEDEQAVPADVELESEYDHDLSMPNTLDTLGVDDSGNWVEKRVYWERAEEAFGKIININAQVSQQQLQYFGTRNDVDKQLDIDRCELGLNESEFTKVLDYLLDILQLDQNQNEANKNDFKITVLDNQDQLLLLQTSLQQLKQLDSDMDSVIIKVIDQVQKCNEYERKAWEDFKQIGRVLNDESARKLYYQVASYRKNSKLILNYLKTDLKNSCESLISRVKIKLSQIKKITSELKDAGIDLKYELKALDQDQAYRKDLGQLVDKSEEKIQPQEHKPKNKSGFWAVFLNSLQTLWQLILWLPRKILGLFGMKF